jgi:hypothetical protein
MAYYIMFLWIPGRDGTRSKVTGNFLVNALHAFNRFNRRYHVKTFSLVYYSSMTLMLVQMYKLSSLCHSKVKTKKMKWVIKSYYNKTKERTPSMQMRSTSSALISFCGNPSINKGIEAFTSRWKLFQHIFTTSHVPSRSVRALVQCRNLIHPYNVIFRPFVGYLYCIVLYCIDGVVIAAQCTATF